VLLAILYSGAEYSNGRGRWPEVAVLIWCGGFVIEGPALKNKKKKTPLVCHGTGESKGGMWLMYIIIYMYIYIYYIVL
jgi:hypothetical protein